MIILYTPITLHGTEYTRSQCTVGNQGHKGTIFCKKRRQTNQHKQTNINQTNINHPHRLDYTYLKYEHTVFKGSTERPLKVKEQTQI